ncbi:MAG: CRISPR-associated endoribonuclease Cas6 [Methanomassiliicoccales archaeon]|jgi:CRISPR-associated endoribonuclease Cas6
MRLTLEFITDQYLKLPIQYNYQIQSLLYNNISPELSTFLHDHGFLVGKRTFKLFTFSRLHGKFFLNEKNGTIVFVPPVYLTVSSPIDKFVSELANTLVHKDELFLGKNKLRVQSIRVHPEPKLSENIKIKMLSPVTVYSTLLTADGKKKTYYYSPYETEFADLIDKNLRKKYMALYRKKPRARKLEIVPLERPHQKLLRYRGTVIKAWFGYFSLKGNLKILQLAYDTGVGSKNSQGFGMFEVAE